MDVAIIPPRPLQELLDEWVETHSNTEKQGTPAWLKKRMKTSGGSEMSTIVCLYPFNSIWKLVMTKLGFIVFKGSIQTRWGNLLEKIIEVYVEDDLNTTLYGTEFFLPGKFPTQSYSPDGVGIVNIDVKLIVKKDIGEQIIKNL